MTPAARIQAAIEILDQVVAGTPAEQALTRWARASRFAGSKDRAAIRDHVFDALRRQRSFAAIGGSMTGRGLMIGAIALGDGDFSLFSGPPYGAAPLSNEEVPSQALGDLPDAVRLDLPAWIWQAFQNDLGPLAEATAQSLAHRAEVFLRVNLRKSTVEAAIAALAAEDIETERHPLSPTALRVVENARRVAQSQPYVQGIVELQDAASQAVCDFLDWPEGGKVLDFCAGGGGKSLALAGRQNGQFSAHDVSFRRMKDLPDRAARAGVRIELLEQVPRTRQFDLVLCDVPCSGSGSWRRSPEGKWLLSPEKLAEVVQVQARILDQVHVNMAPGGELAYATCSVLHAENRGQIDAFLTRHPDWRLIDDRQFLPSDGGDGFYVARLTRL